MSTFRQRLIDEIRFFVEDIRKRRDDIHSNDYELEYEVEADEIMQLHQWNEIADLLPEPDLVDSKGNMRLYLCECKISSPFSKDEYTWWKVSGFVSPAGNFGKPDWSTIIARRDCVRWMSYEEYTPDKYYDDAGNEIDEEENIIEAAEPEIVEPIKPAEPTMADIPNLPHTGEQDEIVQR